MILSLRSISLEAPLQISGECLVLTECLLPRNAIARKAALKDVSVTKGQRSFVRTPFYEKGLLKERVDGPFGLKVSLTRPLKHREFNRFLREILATGIEYSVDLLTPLLKQYAPLDDVFEEGSERIVDGILKDAPFVAVGGLDLDSRTLDAGILEVPLKLERSIRQATTPPGPKSREQRRSRSILYRKGSVIGKIELDLIA